MRRGPCDGTTYGATNALRDAAPDLALVYLDAVAECAALRSELDAANERVRTLTALAAGPPCEWRSETIAGLDRGIADAKAGRFHVLDPKWLDTDTENSEGDVR